jgi:RimJ/RimL family protein N-acetyltransferase
MNLPKDIDFIAREGDLAATFFVPQDGRQLSRWLSRNAEEHFYTSSSLPFPCTLESFLQYYEANFRKGSHEFFSVLHAPTGRHVGHFEIKNISASFQSGTLAHVLLGEPSLRKLGFGKTLVRLMARVGFEHLNFYRIGLSVHISNSTAVAAYVRGGFFFEGIVRDVLQKEGKRFSLYQMSLLKPEWNSAYFNNQGE